MINYIAGDALNVKHGLLIHGCNTIGGFGAGIALAIRKKYPQVYQAFVAMGTGAHLLGKFAPVSIQEDYMEPDSFYIGNCYTQLTVGAVGKHASMDAITSSVDIAYKFCLDNELDTLSMPKIGAGLGGLSWESEVEPIITGLSNKYSSITTNVYYI